jgi:GNAT superfamily N-acetyltransferase
MRRDLVVWLGSFLLFGCGALWAQMWGATDFFKVDSIHDLFDIGGVLVTAVAVIVAIRGVGEWRNQGIATADHDLARRLLIELYRYREAIGHVRNPMILGYEGKKEGENYVVYEKVDMVARAYGERFEKLGEVKSKLLANILESEAVWNGEVKSLCLALFRLERELFIHVRAYLITIDPKQPVDMRQAYIKIMAKQRDILYEDACDDDEYLADINKAFSVVELSLRPKLLRSI